MNRYDDKDYSPVASSLRDWLLNVFPPAEFNAVLSSVPRRRTWVQVLPSGTCPCWLCLRPARGTTYGACPSEERVHLVSRVSLVFCVILSRFAALDACSQAANCRRIVLCIIWIKRRAPANVPDDLPWHITMPTQPREEGCHLSGINQPEVHKERPRTFYLDFLY